MSSVTLGKMRKNANNVSNFPSNNAKRKIIDLLGITPITPAQRETFEFFKRGHNLILKGSAGTGKTFIAMYLALKNAFADTTTDYNKVIIVRSAVATRDIGALPGDLEEKTGIYELPYYSITSELTNKDGMYNTLKETKCITFIPTSYVRGVTFRNSIIIVDEFQNMNSHELYSIITRAGENCRFIFCGDMKQSDLSEKGTDKSGFNRFLKIVAKMESFREVEFTQKDIVRSGLVKEFIIADEST
jgi:phosphate starvation-inducible protein PhoH